VTELDHILIAVDDLDAAARQVEERYGLASVEGGRHQGLGTANRIVPLGKTYLELVAVVDDAEAAGSAFGSWVAGGDIPRLMGWCVRTDDLSGVAGRLGLTIADGARARPDGTVLRWRMAGLERSADEPSLPFFIEWGTGTPYPGEALSQSATIDELRLQGDPDPIADWAGDTNVPLSVSEGRPALLAAVLDGAVLDPTRWA
jgi:Glyoxalase-like domain